MSGTAAAQETGSVSGAVFDQTGGVLQGATVRISGQNLPAGRTTTTTDAGLYSFQFVPPGKYTVEADASGLGKASRPAEVQVGKDTQVDITVGLTGVQEQVTVTAAVPVVDLKSTEVNFNYRDEQIESLPLQRTYAALFQLAPGVAENNTTVGPNAGGSRQDNTYLIDGVNITNPGFGYLSTEVNEFDIQEFNIKRGGITAEFGRSSGFVTNAVTRSGTNDLAGAFRFEMLPKAWVADAKDPTQQETRDRWIPAFYVGGPIMRDRAFFYGSGRFARESVTDRVNRVGPVPDSKTSINELFGKLTAQPSTAHQLNVGYRHRPLTTEFAGIGLRDSPEVATDSEGTNRVATVAWNWFPGSQTAIEVKYLHMDEENETVARTDLGFRPSWDPNNLAAMGYFYDASRDAYFGGAEPRINRANYRRDEVKATFTQFLDFAGAGHQLKAGFGVDDSDEDLARISNGWGNVNVVQGGTRVEANYYPDQPPQLSLGRTYSLFVQDDITVNDRLVVNAGVLLNRDEFAQKIDTRNTFLDFNFFDEVQPRLGANYALRGTGDKLYANYGRYYSLDQKSSARSLAPLRLYTSDAVFDRAGNLLSDAPRASTTGKVIAADVNAPYVDEFLVGYATPFMGDWGLDVFFMYRDADSFIEDFPTVLPSSGFIYDNVPAADRKYRTLTFELSRRLAQNWSLNASYAYSRLYGNFDLDYAPGSTIFNTSSALEDGPGLFVEDENRYGPLSQDRTHVFKLFGTYTPPAVPGLMLGGYFRVQSGSPFEARGRDWYNGYRRYLEPAGTDRNDVWPNFDLLVGYKFTLPRDVRVGFDVRFLNLFDTQTALTRDNRLYLDGRIRDFTNPPYLIQGTTLPNPEYGIPTSWSPPRRVLMSILLNF